MTTQPTTLSGRLRDLHAARVPCYVADTPAQTITATDARWKALLDAADELDRLQAELTAPQAQAKQLTDEDLADCGLLSELDQLSGENTQ